MSVNRFGYYHVDYKQCRHGTDSSASLVTSRMDHPSLVSHIAQGRGVGIPRDDPHPERIGVNLSSTAAVQTLSHLHFRPTYH